MIIVKFFVPLSKTTLTSFAFECFEILCKASLRIKYIFCLSLTFSVVLFSNPFILKFTLIFFSAKSEKAVSFILFIKLLKLSFLESIDQTISCIVDTASRACSDIRLRFSVAELSFNCISSICARIETFVRVEPTSSCKSLAIFNLNLCISIKLFTLYL